MDSESWFKHGKEIERERIIELLENDVQYPPRRADGDSGWVEIKLDQLIALIKADQC